MSSPVIRLACPSCASKFVLPDATAGKSIRCDCGQVFQVPVVEVPEEKPAAVPDRPRYFDPEVAKEIRKLREFFARVVFWGLSIFICWYIIGCHIQENREQAARDKAFEIERRLRHLMDK